jgi:phage terminase large subunit-like protein
MCAASLAGRCCDPRPIPLVFHCRGGLVSDDEMRRILDAHDARLLRLEGAVEASANQTTETRIAVAGLGAKVDGLSDAIRDLATDVRADRTAPRPAPERRVEAAATGAGASAVLLAGLEFVRWIFGGAGS